MRQWIRGISIAVIWNYCSVIFSELDWEVLDSSESYSNLSTRDAIKASSRLNTILYILKVENTEVNMFLTTVTDVFNKLFKDFILSVCRIKLILIDHWGKRKWSLHFLHSLWIYELEYYSNTLIFLYF